MKAKRAKTPVRKIKSLRAKSLSGRKAKSVKGGVIAIIAPSGVPKGGTELLPYIEKKRNP